MATNTRTSSKAAARDRARARRLELDAARQARDEAVEAAMASYYEADDQIEGLRAQIDRAEDSQREAICTLLELKEPAARIQDLLAIDASTYNRLKPVKRDRRRDAQVTELDPHPSISDVDETGDAFDRAAS